MTIPDTSRRSLVEALLADRYAGAVEVTEEMVDAVIAGIEPQSCGETNGASACAVRPGEHAPASNCPDGPVHHVSAGGCRWTGPMSAGEAAMAREDVR